MESLRAKRRRSDGATEGHHRSHEAILKNPLFLIFYIHYSSLYSEDIGDTAGLDTVSTKDVY